MQWTLNFTGRRELPREAARIALRRTPDGGIVFDADLELTEFDFPAESQVFVEAYFKTATERFPWGTVGQITAPGDRRIRRLAQPELAHFRVKVVEAAAEGAGRLLAVADRLAPEGIKGAEKRQISLFRVNVTKEKEWIDDEVWRLNFRDEAGPLLDLNPSVAGVKELVRGEAFMALAFPAIIREIYREIFDDGRFDSEDDPNGWHARWLRFGARWAGPFPIPVEGKPEDEQAEWAAVVKGWCRSQKALSEYRRAVEKGAK